MAWLTFFYFEGKEIEINGKKFLLFLISNIELIDVP